VTLDISFFLFTKCLVQDQFASNTKKSQVGQINSNVNLNYLSKLSSLVFCCSLSKTCLEEEVNYRSTSSMSCEPTLTGQFFLSWIRYTSSMLKKVAITCFDLKANCVAVQASNSFAWRLNPKIAIRKSFGMCLNTRGVFHEENLGKYLS